MKYTVNRASGQSAYIQIYRQLRDDIVAGRLKDGAKLPSKRFAAAELGVSVITVEHAYELLEEEGYIQSRQRSGYYVCFGGEHRTEAVLSFARRSRPTSRGAAA